MISWRQKALARKLLAQERNTVIKDPGGKLSIALAYPNKYSIGMSNLGFQSIYSLLNQRKDTMCERVFLPDFPLASNETLISLERQSPVYEFEIVAFSVSYENDYLNILNILQLARLPLLADERTEKDPLVIMGGVCASFNSEPLVPFIDCFLIGEGEVVVPQFIDHCLAWPRKDRQMMLLQLAGKPHFYVPKFYKIQYDAEGTVAKIVPKKEALFPITRAVANLDHIETSTKIVTSKTELGNMHLIEIGRGCRRGCHFCLMTNLYKPYRARPLSLLLPGIDHGLSHRDVIGLVSASPTDHPQILEICSAIVKKGGKVSVSSLRFESITEEFLQYLLMSGHKTITLAPEAGSDRLRNSIGKKLTNEAILEKIRLITAHGIPNIKLYFMIGLPSEKDDDIKAIETLIKKIKHIMLQEGKKRASLGKITVSINCFVPKPFSRFERCSMEEVSILQSKLKFLLRHLKDISNVYVIHDVPKWAFIQGLLARGDRRVGEMLLQVFKNKGNWKLIFQTMNLNPSFYTARERGEKEVLPWDIFRRHFSI